MLTILEVHDDADEQARQLLARPQEPGVRWVLVRPDRLTWTEAPNHEQIIEHVEAPLRPGSRTRRVLLRPQQLIDLVALHRPAAIVCGSLHVAPLMAHVAAGRLRPRPALIGAVHGSRGHEAPGLAALVPSLSSAVTRAASWWSTQNLGRLDAVFVGSLRDAEPLRAAGVERIYHTPRGVDLDVFSPTRREQAARGAIPHDTSLGLFDEGFVAETCSTPSTAAFRLRAPAENPGARSRDGLRHGLLGRIGELGRERLIVGLAIAPDIDAALLRRLHAALARRLPVDPALVILDRGASESRARLQRLAASVAHVHLPDSSDADIRAQWLAACDLVVCLGDDGPAIAEAMACARPIIAAGSPAERVEESRCGRVLASLDAEPIAEAVLALWRGGELDQLGARGRSFIMNFERCACLRHELACVREVVAFVRAGQRVPTGIHARMLPG